ncbi:DNA-binding LacI/PurR family transcriptional regulator [Microbacterium sp. W4I4]|uniref:LacI family DNA-binding transcriptional regulator n=1 Tax=Microbacterium sp. W4I4 TaxID=3042295 RepID=UPI00278550DC|nr:LacI family DNA-binding transcriptional regulator [Microbacterium sp. W4I4]MDQ0613832.1 DNA-binding LacI/PurR family transcriptional regulator [Microbacterium sp. W4I4]
MSATMHDVARLAGVSAKTVSNVVNDYLHVRPAVRERVRAAIAELDYRPNLNARGLRSGRSRVIGLAVPSLRENYFAELADAVIRAAARHDLIVVVEQTGGRREAELNAVSNSRPRLLDGLLFSPVALGQDDVDALDVGSPLVLLGERIFGGPTDHVTMHNTSSARAATEHLLGIGRRRIAVIGADPRGAEANSANLRVRGYREALESAGVPIDPALVRETPMSEWHRAGGAAAMRRLIDDGVPFDAVFALSDTLGLGALRALGERGRRVPDDVAVIGFDNIDESAYSLPSMSTVDTGRDDIAAIAVERLILRIDEKDDRRAPETFKPDFRIVARESTGHSDAEQL